jgi:hypothetical protein
MTQDEIDYSRLAEQIDPEQIAAELDTGKIAEDRFMLTRRQLAAVAGSGLGAGALGALGIGDAEAQTSGQAGTIGTSSQPVDLEAQNTNTKTINDNYLYATEFNSLNDALSAASDGTVINLGKKRYTEDITVSNTGISFVGTDTSRSEIRGDVTVNSKHVTFQRLSLAGSASSDSLTIQQSQCQVVNCVLLFDATLGSTSFDARMALNRLSNNSIDITGGGRQIVIGNANVASINNQVGATVGLNS